MVALSKPRVGRLCLAVLMGIGVGACVPVQRDMDALVEPPPRHGPAPRPMAPAKRFQADPDAATSPAESVVALSDKYAALNAEATSLRENGRVLEEENRALKQRISTLEADLQRTQEELAQANSLLMEILGELNTWKRDVLGFREEMRQASKAELEALLKVLEVLGAELPEPNVPEPAAATTTAITAASKAKP